MKLLKNLTGLVVGPDSKKRQLGIVAGTIIVGLRMADLIDQQIFELAMLAVGSFTGFAFSAKLTKIAKTGK